MYGNYEYGVIPYGDAITSILIAISRNEIAFIFVSNGKTFEFISPRQSNIFLSEQISRDLATAQKKFNEFISARQQPIFVSEKKQNAFISARKNRLFISPKE